VSKRWEVGDEIHGFANGYFGRDSYECRVVELTGRDFLVTRNTRGEVELITRKDADQIEDPEDRGYCECPKWGDEEDE
jgi:hypothetical protein